MNSPTMLDLFAGRGGASRAMRERGWTVTTVELEASFQPDIAADICTWRWEGGPVDLLWASPPCTEFSRESMPWCRTGETPDISCVLATLRLVHEVQPRFWALENVRGARRWLEPLLGPPAMRSGPVFLWGRLPFGLLPRVAPYKTKQTGERPDLRSELPYEISLAIARATEQQLSARAVGSG